MSAPDRRALLDRDHAVLSIRRQCALVSVARSGIYRQPPPRNYGYRAPPPANYGYREPPPNYAYREAPEDYVYPAPSPAYRYYGGPPVVRVLPPPVYPYYPYRRYYSFRHGPRVAGPYWPRGYRNW